MVRIHKRFRGDCVYRQLDSDELCDAQQLQQSRETKKSSHEKNGWHDNFHVVVWSGRHVSSVSRLEQVRARDFWDQLLPKLAA